MKTVKTEVKEQEQLNQLGNVITTQVRYDGGPEQGVVMRYVTVQMFDSLKIYMLKSLNVMVFGSKFGGR